MLSRCQGGRLKNIWRTSHIVLAPMLRYTSKFVTALSHSRALSDRFLALIACTSHLTLYPSIAWPLVPFHPSCLRRYDQISEQYPEEFEARVSDKLRYR